MPNAYSVIHFVRKRLLLYLFSASFNILFFIIAILIYACIGFLISLSFRFERIGIINAIWNGLSLLMIILLGYFAFNEKITMKELSAIILIIIAIFLVL